MKSYLFPGQGSQFKGMGSTLFDEFADITEKADRILEYSIKQLCLENPKGQLRLTQYTQPALYVVNALTYFKKMKESEERPDFVAGHSLGEYNALLASGAFDFETGLKLVKKRGELMGKASGGAMAAVMGLTEKKIRHILKNNDLTELDIANLNSQTQIIVSGTKDDINRAQPFFEKEGATYFPLNVSAAFHSRYMQEARDEYAEFIKDFDFSALTIPVVSNVTAKLYNDADIAANLANQLRSSVKWSESIRFLMSQGEMDFEELGPGDVLTKLAKKIETEPLDLEENSDATLVTELPAKEEEISKVEAQPPSKTVESKYESNDEADGKDEEAEQAKTSADTEGVIAVEDTDSIKKDEGISDDKTAGKVSDQRGMEAAQEKVTIWNKTHPIGTRVRVEGYDEELETRTEAVILFGHRAAVYMVGYNGYFALDEVTPVEVVSA